MQTKKLNRRDWIRTGLLTAGGISLMPHLGFGQMPRTSIPIDLEGNALYSPFLKEYIYTSFPDPNVLAAKLNANENPYGPSANAVEAFKQATGKGNRYAWKELFALMDKIALKEGVERKNIMMGPGSSDLLEKTAMVLFLNGGNIVSADPSYMSLMQVAQAIGATWKGVPLKKDWSHDLKGMEAAIDSDTKLVYICNPNNPTGSMTEHGDLVDFCARVSEKVPVFIDEAYLDFLEDADKKSMVSLINQGKNVIIARTFSKIHGMAGLRVGYIVAQESTLGEIEKITRGGMGITYPSIEAALASMDDVAFQDRSRTLNAQAKNHVYENLKKLGYDYVPSSTSFILFPINMDGKIFLEKMAERKIGVRAFKIMDKNWCRVSMGTLDEMKMFTAALKEVVA